MAIGRRVRAVAAGAAALAATLLAPAARAQVIMNEVPDPMKGIGQEDRLGQTIPMDVELINWEGKKVRIGEYFDAAGEPGAHKPVILALVYFSCPMMCPLMLSRIQDRVNELPYIVGEDFTLLVVSFDPREKPALASSNRSAFLAGYRIQPTNAVTERGFLFHVAEAGQAKKLADAVGFAYSFDEKSGEYAHGSALTILTGSGVVSRYVDGLSAEKGELRLALLEASEGKIASSIGDFFLHFCFRWDARQGKYTLAAMRVMQAGAVLTMTAVGVLIVGLRAGDRWRAARREAALAGAGSGPGVGGGIGGQVA